MIKNGLMLLLGLVLISQANRLNSTDGGNLLYTLHTASGDIQCNYHNSRDLDNGWMMYIDHITKEQKFIEYWSVDSITVHKDYWLVSGPKDKKMRYIYEKN